LAAQRPIHPIEACDARRVAIRSDPPSRCLRQRSWVSKSGLGMRVDTSD